MRKLAILLTVGLLASLVAVLAPTSPAGAFEESKITIETKPGARKKLTSTRGMYGNDPAPELHKPEECAVTTTCTVVPLEVAVTPDAPDEYFLTITIDWDDSEVAGTAQGNDLDIYAFTFDFVRNEEGEIERDEEGKPVEDYVEVGRSAGGTAPEQFKLFTPPAKRVYYIDVVNFIGVNRGFTVDVAYTGAAFVPPTENFGDPSAPAAPPSTPGAPAPAPAAGGPVAASPSAGPSSSPSFGPSPTPRPRNPTPLGLAPVGDDDDFGFADNESGFNDLLRASDETRGSLFEERNLGPPKEVAGSTLLVWLGLLPVLLAAGAGFWFFRRRPAALSFSLPSTTTASPDAA